MTLYCFLSSNDLNILNFAIGFRQKRQIDSVLVSSAAESGSPVECLELLPNAAVRRNNTGFVKLHLSTAKAVDCASFFI